MPSRIQPADIVEKIGTLRPWWPSLQSVLWALVPFWVKAMLPMATKPINYESIFSYKRHVILRELRILLSSGIKIPWILAYLFGGLPVQDALASEMTFDIPNFINRIYLVFITIVMSIVFIPLDFIPVLCILHTACVHVMLWMSHLYLKLTRPPPHSRSKFPHERWFYINGILNTINTAERATYRLHELFETDPCLLYNPTQGLICDMATLFFGRTFDWPSYVAYHMSQDIKEALLNPAINKVVLIGHSNGTIVASNVLRLFAAEMSCPTPSNLQLHHLKKLEVYLIASVADDIYFQYGPTDPFRAEMIIDDAAACEFHIRSLQTSTKTQRNEDKDRLDNPSEPSARGQDGPAGNRGSTQVRHRPGTTFRNNAVYIELFGNTNDPAAWLGCLSEEIVKEPDAKDFVFKKDRAGHFLNTHYLDRELSDYYSPTGWQSHLLAYLKKPPTHWAGHHTATALVESVWRTSLLLMLQFAVSPLYDILKVG